MKSSIKLVLICAVGVLFIALIIAGFFGIVNSRSSDADVSKEMISTAKLMDKQASVAEIYVLAHKKPAEEEQNGADTSANGEQSSEQNNAGETYVDVNISTQTLVFYVNGKVEMTTPVVTGCVAEECDTPTGSFAIYDKTADTVLTGPTWNDHVDYWMPFYGAYGLHDADGWRSEYGGNIYQENGSHGCVNMPSSAAGVIFQKAEIGTPVIIHY